MPMIDVQLHEDDYVEGAAAASAPGRSAIADVIAAVVATVAGLLWLWWAGRPLPSLIGFGSLTGALIGGRIGRRVSIAGGAKRRYRQQRGLQRPYTVSWTSDAITFASEQGASTIPWADFHNLRETDNLFLLFLSDANFLIVPKRAFPDALLLDAFRDVVGSRFVVR